MVISGRTLRSRTNRLCEFEDVHQTEAVLEQLLQREDGPFVVRLGREPGKRESRYAHLFCGEVSHTESQEHEEAAVSSDESRLAQLEKEVDSLRQELDEIKARLDQLSENE
ncbi:MAG: hypothetical protein B6D71_05270 [gamma proteobacterium symbiont of Stewartia floridana]|nr:MAG: hypothetical protein B6D71_05270 [gamma proteobacterium symbiont of Stewartia floridana]